MAIGSFQENVSGSRLYVQGLFETSATQKQRLGTIRVLEDGRRFVYCQATAAQLAAGVCVSKAVAPQALTVAALDAAQNVVGALTLYFTLTGAPTLNLYKDGMLVMTLNEGVGEMYKVKGNSADNDPATGRFTVNLYDALKTTHVAASSTADIYANPYDGVLINPAVADGDATTGEKILGVTTRIVAASYYFWAQTWGLASVLLDIDAAAGSEADERVLVPGTTAGRLLLSAAGAENDQQVYGYPLETSDQDDAEAALVDLKIS